MTWRQTVSVAALLLVLNACQEDPDPIGGGVEMRARSALGCTELRLALVGERHLVALPGDGLWCGSAVVLRRSQPLRVISSKRVTDDDACCAVCAKALLGPAADLDGDGQEEVVLYRWTGIQYHTLTRVLRLEEDRLTIVAGPIFGDGPPQTRFDPETGRDLLVIRQNHYSPLGPRWGEHVSELLWRNGRLRAFRKLRRLPVPQWSNDEWIRSASAGIPPDFLRTLWEQLMGRDFDEVAEAHAWWRTNRHRFRRDGYYTFDES